MTSSGNRVTFRCTCSKLSTRASTTPTENSTRLRCTRWWCQLPGGTAAGAATPRPGAARPAGGRGVGVRAPAGRQRGGAQHVTHFGRQPSGPGSRAASVPGALGAGTAPAVVVQPGHRSPRAGRRSCGQTERGAGPVKFAGQGRAGPGRPRGGPRRPLIAVRAGEPGPLGRPQMRGPSRRYRGEAPLGGVRAGGGRVSAGPRVPSARPSGAGPSGPKVSRTPSARGARYRVPDGGDAEPARRVRGCSPARGPGRGPSRSREGVGVPGPPHPRPRAELGPGPGPRPPLSPPTRPAYLSEGRPRAGSRMKEVKAGTAWSWARGAGRAAQLIRRAEGRRVT